MNPKTLLFKAKNPSDSNSLTDTVLPHQTLLASPRLEAHKPLCLHQHHHTHPSFSASMCEYEKLKCNKPG